MIFLTKIEFKFLSKNILGEVDKGVSCGWIVYIWKFET